MKFNVEDTYSIYEKIVAESNIEKKREIFKDELIKPVNGAFNAWGISIDKNESQAMEMLKNWAFLMPEALDEKILDPLHELKKHNAWKLCEKTLNDVNILFHDYWVDIPLNQIEAGIYLLDEAKMNPIDRGYTGIGGTPGYVMMLYSHPNEYNMPRIQATLAHEIHHNIRLSLFPWKNPMNLTVAEHIITEGIAEAFATELYGEDKLGYYVTDIEEKDVPNIKNIIKNALNVKDFNKTRSYVYGDRASEVGVEKIGLPNFAGIAIGYYIIKSWLENTGKNIIEATFTPTKEIIKESKYFHK